jgi:hypothetical protein
MEGKIESEYLNPAGFLSPSWMRIRKCYMVVKGDDGWNWRNKGVELNLQNKQEHAKFGTDRSFWKSNPRKW